MVLEIRISSILNDNCYLWVKQSLINLQEKAVSNAIKWRLHLPSGAYKEANHPVELQGICVITYGNL